MRENGLKTLEKLQDTLAKNLDVLIGGAEDPLTAMEQAAKLQHEVLKATTTAEAGLVGGFGADSDGEAKVTPQFVASLWKLAHDSGKSEKKADVVDV